MVFTDIVSEASFGAAMANDDNRASMSRRHVLRTGRSVVPVTVEHAGDIVGSLAGDANAPSVRVETRSDRSYGTGYVSRRTDRSDRSSAVLTASSRTSVSRRLIEIAPEETKGYDAVRPPSLAVSRLLHGQSQVSPFDSVSVAGHAQRGNDPEFVREQQQANANAPSAQLTARLAAASSRVSPAVRSRVAMPAQCVTDVAGSSHTETTYKPPSVHPSQVAGSILGSRSRASKIVMSRTMLADIAGTQVCEDINLRVVNGHNIIVLRDGASLEVVDEDGIAVDAIDIQDRAHRQSLGFPPLTPRDLHDALRSGTGGKYGVVKRGDDFVMVRTAASGRSRATSRATGANLSTSPPTRGIAAASHLLRHC